MRLLLLIAALLLMTPVSRAAPRPDSSCSWNPSTLSAPGTSIATVVNLPTNRTISFSYDQDPPGGGVLYPSGSVTFQANITQTTALRVWSRGGNGSLGNAGPQRGDYHLIATCTVVVG